MANQSKTFPSRFILFLVYFFIAFFTTMTAQEEASNTEQQQLKTIFLIRHAESEENRRIASLSRCFRTLGTFSLPSKADIRASTELLNVAAQVDSNVSEQGALQISEMGQTLKDANFVESSGIELVVHSPLTRARETSEGMLGCAAPDKKASSVGRVVELELLKEKTPSEWTPVYWNSFKERISEFERWLGDQPEEKIALVGHSQYFKAMLGLDFKFGNCDVWQATFDVSKMADPQVETATAGDVQTKVAANDPTCDSPEASGWTLPPQWSKLKVLFKAKAEGEK